VQLAPPLADFFRIFGSSQEIHTGGPTNCP
jgi:hypothetical protein